VPAARLPLIKTPMAATQVTRPFHHPGWIYEEKVDGWRGLAYKDAAGARLVSRNARDLTRRFPELVAAVAALEVPTLLLDGEIAVFDRRLLSRLEWLRGRPLRVRRNVLEALLDGQRLILPARRLADDGLEAWSQVLERGYEGLVGKDAASPYREGRTLSWLKVKQPRYREGERGWEPKGKS